MKKLTALAVSLTIGCHLEPPSMPDEEATRQRLAQRESRAAQARLAEAEPAVIAARQQHEAAVAALAAAHEREKKAAADAQEATAMAAAYSQAIADARTLPWRCASVTSDEIGRLYKFLVQFTAEPQRDQAIAGMESCRRDVVRDIERAMKVIDVDVREKFAIRVEEKYDEANPYHKGELVAVVKGKTLAVKMRGAYGGRPRHSQAQVDAWCAETSVFDSITLRNAHGSFSCRPKSPPREVFLAVMEEYGLAGPWTAPVAGNVPTPTMEAPPPPLDTASLQEAIATAEAAKLVPEAEAANAAKEAERSRATIRRLEAEQEARVAEWRTATQASARSLTRVGVGITIVGAIGTSLGAYAATLRANTARNVAAMEAVGAPSMESLNSYTAQSRGMVAGLAIGIPLLATGVLLLVAGKRRRDAAQAPIAITPSGVRIAF